MSLFIRKNPNPSTLLAKSYADTCPAGYEPSTEQAAAAWVAEQLASGWAPVHPDPAPISAEPLRQATDIVLDRMTDAEIDALTSPTAPTFARRAWLAATATGIISEADPRFASLTAALNQVGIIAADRWTDLLAQ